MGRLGIVFSMSPLPLLLLVVAIAWIVVATTRWRLHPFLALLVAACGYGLGNGLPVTDTLAAVTGGLGRTVGAIGIVIGCGCIIGTLLQHTGAARVMAETALRIVGAARSVLALSVTGAVVSIPVFSDSGFVVLSPLARSLARKTKESVAACATALSLGLYITHCLVPPTPGPVAAAAAVQADLGQVIMLGLLVAIPVVVVTWRFAIFIGRCYPAGTTETEPPVETSESRPGIAAAFGPIFLPVALIAARSLAGDAAPSWLVFCGDPNIALMIGAFFALALARRHGGKALGEWSGEALRVAGAIILITAAGGAFGAVLRATPLADQIGRLLELGDLGRFNLLLPFLVAAGLKTAQGSSTVALITTASLIAPLLPALGLDEPTGAALTTLAIGAGSMTVSHVNDSFFWVVTQLSGLSISQGYRTLTIGSALAGGTALAVVLLLGLALL